MRKTAQEIEAKVRQVYEMVSESKTPISTLGQQTTMLRATGEFTHAEVEHIRGEVMGLLIRHGWRKSGDSTP